MLVARRESEADFITRCRGDLNTTKNPSAVRWADDECKGNWLDAKSPMILSARCAWKGPWSRRCPAKTGVGAGNPGLCRVLGGPSALYAPDRPANRPARPHAELVPCTGQPQRTSSCAGLFVGLRFLGERREHRGCRSQWWVLFAPWTWSGGMAFTATPPYARHRGGRTAATCIPNSGCRIGWAA